MDRVFLWYSHGNKIKWVRLVLLTAVILVHYEFVRFVIHKYNLPKITLSPTNRITLKTNGYKLVLPSGGPSGKYTKYSIITMT